LKTRRREVPPPKNSRSAPLRKKKAFTKSEVDQLSFRAGDVKRAIGGEPRKRAASMGNIGFSKRRVKVLGRV